MSPSSLYELFDRNPTQPYRIIMASGDRVIVDRPKRTLIVELELYIGQSDNPDAPLGNKLRVVSIPNINIVEPIDPPSAARASRRRR